VKVCGLRFAEDARCAATAGAHLCGVVQVSASPRCASPAEAAAVTAAIRAFRNRDPSSRLAALMPPPSLDGVDAATSLASLAARSARFITVAATVRPLTVGIFQDVPPHTVAATALAARFDVVQLHGSEVPADWVGFPAPIVKALPVPAVLADDEAVAAAAAALAAGVIAWAPIAAAILLDTKLPAATAAGGAGVLFDHHRVLAAASQALRDAAGEGGAAAGAPTSLRIPVLLAGGLNPANVAPCLRVLGDGGWLSSRPPPPTAPAPAIMLVVAGVDASSGVEVEAAGGGEKGRKEHGKVEAFVKSALTALAV